MDPLFVNNQNHSLRTISDSSTINLIAIDDTFDSMSTSSTIPIIEQTVTQQKSLSSKISELLVKNMSYIIATSGNIVAQMIISTTVAKTPWNIENIVNSLEFSGGIIAIDTLGEPRIFNAIDNIKSWVWNKWTNNDTNINFKKELVVVTSFLLGLSYSAVLLDRASNHLLDNAFSLAIVQQTSVEFASYVLNMTFHGAIISTFEKGIKLSWKKIKNLFNRNNNSNIDVEAQLINNEQNNSLQSEAANNFFYQNLLPLFLIVPISITITWATENCISNQEFTFDKWLTDMPKVTGGVMLSLISSLLNCMVNGQKIPFLPNITIKTIMNTIKSCCGCQKKDSTKDIVTTNPNFANNQTTVDSASLFYEDWPRISDDISSTNSLLTSSDQFCIFPNQEFEAEIYDFKKLQLGFITDEDNEQYFDAVEYQEIESETLFDSRLVNSYGTFSSDSEDKNSSDSGISSEDILSNKLQLITI